jgi:hypothetical protein
MPKKKRFSRSFGSYGNRLRVGQRSDKVYFGEWRDTDSGRYVRKTLGRDRTEALQWAQDEVARRTLGLAQNQEVDEVTPTCSRVFAAYEMHRMPVKGPNKTPPTQQTQDNDKRCSEMWTRVLGAGFDLRELDEDEHWSRFIQLRRSGAIDARGNAVKEDKRRPVRDRTLERDCNWLVMVLNWATTRRERGKYLMDANPARGFDVPREKNPQRPVATEGRYLKLIAKADEHLMAVSWLGKRVKIASYLKHKLVIHNGTARRDKAVRTLRREDLRYDNDGELVGIAWPAERDKMGKGWYADITPEVAEAVTDLLAIQKRCGIVSPYLFPAPRDYQQPIGKRLAARWLEKLEDMANVPHLKQGKWHPYRRKWATERKGHADVDVCAAGGWSDTRSLKVAYQHADSDSVRKVIFEPTHKVREVVA